MGGWCSLASSSDGPARAPWTATTTPWQAPVSVETVWGGAEPVSPPPSHLRDSPPSAAVGARGASVGGGGAPPPYGD
jgi:hypothetical protein